MSVALIGYVTAVSDDVKLLLTSSKSTCNHQIRYVRPSFIYVSCGQLVNLVVKGRVMVGVGGYYCVAFLARYSAVKQQL